MGSLLRLYFAYLRTAASVMIWAALTFSAYAFIRTSTVAETIVAAVVAITLSLILALPIISYLWPTGAVRKKVAVIVEAARALLLNPESRSTSPR